jgi:FKBP-type peptidyl-prolyl cis-trans isomerase
MAVKGWDVVVATMKVGEKCLAKLKSAYAFGSEGSQLGDSMAIPPDTDIDYEIELVSFEKVCFFHAPNCVLMC